MKFPSVPKMGILQIVKHAHAYHQIHGSGCLDPRLTEIGREQCSKMTGLSGGDLILSSTLKRALETATCIFQDNTIYATDLLCEYNTGAACNTRSPSTDLEDEFGGAVDFNAYRIDPLPQEISLEDGLRRADRIISILRGLSLSRVTIVTHGNFIKCIVYRLTGEYPNEQENTEMREYFF